MAGGDKAELVRAWRLLASFLGEGPRPDKEADPALVRTLAARHRLDAALAEPALTAVSPADQVNAETWRDWQAAHTAALARAVWRAGPARRVFDALAPTPVIVLKGAAYAELLYPSPGARAMGDFDVLVPSEELPAALSKLERLGFYRYHPGDPTLDAPGYHERQLGSADLDLDLHQAFTQPERLQIDYRDVFARSLPWPQQAPNARLLAPEDALVYHAVHAACAEFTPEWFPAIGLLDLRQMVQRSGPFWGKAGRPALDLALAIRRAREWGAERMLYATLALSAQLFPSLAPAAQTASTAVPLAAGLLLERLILARASPPGLADPGRAEVLLRKALLLRPSARLRLLRLRIPQLLAGG